MTVMTLCLLAALPAGINSIPWLHILALIGCGLVILAALAIFIFSMVLGWRGLQRKCAQTLALKLSSQSNLPVSYRLRVELNGLEQKVRLVWRQDDQRLKFTTFQKTTYVEEALSAPKSPAGKRKPKPKGGGKTAVEQEYQKVNKFANLLASIASTLASLLPGPLKGPFSSFAGTIRKEQAAVGQVKADKDRVTSSTKMLDSNIKQLGKVTGQQKNVQQPGGKEATGESAAFPEGLSRRLIAHSIPVVFTRPLEPQEISYCELQILPRLPFRSLSGDCQITSLPVEQKEFPAYGVLEQSALPGRVEIKAPAWFYPALYGLLGIASLTVNFTWCAYVVRWLAAIQ